MMVETTRSVDRGIKLKISRGTITNISAPKINQKYSKNLKTLTNFKQLGLSQTTATNVETTSNFRNNMLNFKNSECVS